MTDEIYMLDLNARQRVVLMAALGRLRVAVAAEEGGPNPKLYGVPLTDQEIYDLGQLVVNAEQYDEEDELEAEVEAELARKGESEVFTQRQRDVIAGALGVSTRRYLETGDFGIRGLRDPSPVTVPEVLEIVRTLADLA